MQRSIVLAILAVLTLATGVNAATLNKCIDAKGQVTYSNLPCRNAREVRTVEIDPAPLPDPVRAQPASAVQAEAVQAQPAKAAPQAAISPKKPTSIQIDTQRTPGNTHTTGKSVSHASQRQCDTLTDQLGRVFDKMDQARRKGYTQKQMDAWNLEVKELERKKQRAGCF